MMKQQFLPAPPPRVKARTPYNTTPVAGEKNSLPSMTIPDQVIPMKDLLVRFSNGQSLEERLDGTFDESELPDPRGMDLAEIQEEAEQIYDRLQALREAQEAAQSKAAESSGSGQNPA